MGVIKGLKSVIKNNGIKEKLTTKKEIVKNLLIVKKKK